MICIIAITEGLHFRDDFSAFWYDLGEQYPQGLWSDYNFFVGMMHFAIENIFINLKMPISNEWFKSCRRREKYRFSYYKILLSFMT